LTKILGYPITLDPEWAMLWKTLQVSYPDNSTFVPSIATVIVTWCDAFTAWLEGEENEESVEKLLDALKSRNRLEIVIEVDSFSRFAALKIDSIADLLNINQASHDMESKQIGFRDRASERKDPIREYRPGRLRL
jgi:hypothetical protein